MKSKTKKMQTILMKGVLIALSLIFISSSFTYAVEGLTLQASTALEILMYGEVGSAVRKMEEHFKSKTTLYIVNEIQLRALAEYVNAGNSCYGKVIELLNDIKINSNVDWTPIGTENTPFQGTFKGNGYTVTNLTYTLTKESDGNIGLFGVSNGNIEKLTVNNSKIAKVSTNNDYFNIGNIAGVNNGKIKDCNADKMPLGLTSVEAGTDANKYVGLIAGKNANNGIEKSEAKEISKVEITNNTDTINLDPTIYVKHGEEDYKEITDFLNTVYLQENDKVKFEISIDKYIYTGLENGNKIKLADVKDEEGNVTSKAAEEIYPKLSLGSLVFKPISATQEEIDNGDGTKTPKTFLVYEATVEQTDTEFTSNNVTINFRKNLNNENLFVYYDVRENNFDTANELKDSNSSKSFGNVDIKVDTKKPSVDINAYLEDATESKRYPEGKEIIITVKTTEKVQANIAPEVRVSFSESGLGKYNYQENTTLGNAKHIDAVIDENGKTTWTYSYIINPGDEGKLNIEFVSGSLTDLANNQTDLTKLEKKEIESIYADTTAPVVTIELFNNNKVDYAKEYDINEDGVLDIKDLLLVIKYNAEKLEVNSKEWKQVEAKGDVNGDKKIDSNDSTLIARKILCDENEMVNNITNEDTNVFKIRFSEELQRDLTKEDITVNNGYVEDIEKLNECEYLVTVKNNIATGNVGELILTIEKGTFKDLVGHENVRTEKIIRIDKKAPLLLSLEAYSTSEILLDTTVSNVKEKYRTGDKITVIATFDENITGLPKLTLQFSESGDAKGEITSTLEGNKITYTYTITDGDEGTLSVKGFSGTVTDKAGNITRVTKRVLDGDTIIADTVAPRLQELNITSPSEGSYKAGTIVTIEAKYDEKVYALENNEIKKITNSSAPTLKISVGNSNEVEATFKEYGTTDGKVDESKLIYTYAIRGEEKNEEDVVTYAGDNGEVKITKYENKENVFVCDLAGNKAILTVNQTGNKIIADTIRPNVTNITATVENPNVQNTNPYYKAENDIKITLTFSEKVSSAKIFPEILVGFSENDIEEPTNYNTYSYESNWNVDSTTVEYTYKIKEGDNGYLWVKVPEDQFADAAGNGNIAKDAIKLNVYADTINPTITLLKDTELNQANQTITVKATFSEDVYDLYNNSRVSLSPANAPKLIYSFGTGNNNEISASSVSGAVITYVITKDPVKDNGTLHYELAKGNLCDRAGNEYYQETTDTTAPELKEVYITSDSTHEVYCKKDVNIKVIAIFDEDIANQNMKIRVKIGEGQEQEIAGAINNDNKKEVIFNYTVKDGDNGNFTILDVQGDTLEDESLTDKTYGYVQDKYGNQKNIFNFNGIQVNGEAIADTIAPTVTITSDVERTNKDTVTYTFTWSETVTGFTANDIELTNGLKGEFEVIPNTDGKVYTLKVDKIAEGMQVVRIFSGACEDLAGNENKEKVTYNKVFIDCTKPIIRAKVNGGNYVIATDSNKSTLVENIVINEELSKFEYIWATSETLPETGWSQADVSGLIVNSDITIKTEVSEENTYYLYLRATDLAGNVLEARTNGFKVTKDEITLTPSTAEITNQDVIVNVTYGINLTENRKAGVSGKTSSADETKVIVSENGTVYAEATDKAGNKVYKTLEITNIDKVAPEATITYTTNEDGSITAKISFNEEDVIITNNSGNDTYKFTENGEFTFEFKDKAGNTGKATASVTNIEEKDTTAPMVMFRYTLTTVTVDEPLGATILTDEDAKIEYKWDNDDWVSTTDYVRSQNASKKTNSIGKHILYAKATDRSGNVSDIQELEFNVVKKPVHPEIIFENLTTVQTNGNKYVKIPNTLLPNNLTEQMNKEALGDSVPQYKNLTEDGKLRTGSEITLDNNSKYIVVVIGDVNCDGEVSPIDVTMANSIRLGKATASDIQILAADFDSENSIKPIDITMINSYRLGKLTISI